MVPSADAYIVVLDTTADGVRALLFDSEARRVEGYSAQLPRPTRSAGADCLDELHRLVHAAGFRAAAVVGRADSEVTAEDRECWPAFATAAWFPALPEGAGALLGSGCVSRERFALVLGPGCMIGTVSETPVNTEGLTCAPIDSKRWMISGVSPEASAAYASLKHAVRGSLEKYLENAASDDPQLAALDLAARRLREVYESLSRSVGTPEEVIAGGEALLKAPSLSHRFLDALGVPLTLSTEPEPAGRGAAVWALEQIGAIGDLRALPASLGALLQK